MVILALETVTRAGSLALWVDGTCAVQAGDSARTHGERLPGELTAFLSAHGRTVADVDVFAVVSGPGSFTGLRIGMAAVQGLALASHRRAIGIPTLEALAATWTPDDDSQVVLLVPCLDGQRGDVFFSAMLRGGPSSSDEAAVVLPPSVATPVEAAPQIAAVAGRRRVVLLGDGAVRYRDVWLALMPEAIVMAAPATLAEGAARLAAARAAQAGAPHALRPMYVRRPDAVMARERAGVGAPEGPPRLAVRLASGPEDLQAVEHLQQLTFTNPWGADAIRWELENTDVARLYVGCEPHGALVAYCACWIVFDELHINSFAVDPAWRRQGLARLLLRHVLGEAAAAGARSATLEVRRSNRPAIALYEGLGFRVEATRRDYYQEPREDALILWHRALTPPLANGQKSTPAV